MTTRFTVQALIAEKTWQQKHEAVSPIKSAVTKQRKMKAVLSLPSHFYSVRNPSQQNFKWVIPPHLPSLETPSQKCPMLCFLGDTRLCQMNDWQELSQVYIGLFKTQICSQVISFHPLSSGAHHHFIIQSLFYLTLHGPTVFSFMAPF